MKKHRPYKHAEKPLEISDLPKNRREVFLDRLKNRWPLFLGIGGLLLVSFIPFIGLHFYEDLELSDLYRQYLANSLDQSAYLRLSFSTKNSFNLLNILWFALVGLFLAGLIRIIEHLAYDEPVFFGADFWTGIKKNWLFYVFGLAFLAFLYFLIAFVSYFAGAYSDLVYGILLGLTAALILPLLLYSLAQNVVYKLGLGGYLRNSSVFFVKHLPASFLFVVLFLLPFLCELIPNYAAKYLVLVFLIVVYLPLLIFAFFLYASSLMDRHINRKFYPSELNKGFYPESKSEEETLQKPKP